MVELYGVRVISDIGKPTLYAVTKGFSVISVHKKRKIADDKVRRLNKKINK